LDTDLENPGQRTQFKHPHLIEWAKAHRVELVTACLTIARGWVAEGRPEWTTTRLGGFEGWAKVMGGILDVARVPGFLGNVDELFEAAQDEGGDDLHAFFTGWWRTWHDKELKAKELVGMPETPGDDRGGERSHATRLGIILRQALGTVRTIEDGKGSVGNGTMVTVKLVHNASTRKWRLEKL